MRQLEVLIKNLKEAKSHLLNQIDPSLLNAKNDFQSYKAQILKKRKALLGLELKIQKLQSPLKRKSKKP